MIEEKNVMNKNSLDDINYLLYIERNYDKSLLLITQRFSLLTSMELKNKHRCNRDPYCECVRYGLLLIDIFENKSNGKNIISNMETFYYFIHFIPFPVIRAMIKSCLKILDFTEVKRIIDLYITYSVLPSEVIDAEQGQVSNSLSQKLNLIITKEEVKFTYVLQLVL